MSGWTKKTVAVGDIDLDASPQMRVAGVDDEHLALVGAAKDLPAVALVRTSAEGAAARYLIVDGWHRVIAAKKAGRRTVDASFCLGTDEDATWLACGANRRNGLSRSAADKRNAVTRALSHPHGAGLSDRQIAEHCGVGHPLVGEVRAALATGSDSSRRVGRDGRSVDTSGVSASNKTRAAKARTTTSYDRADAMREDAESLPPGDREMPVHVGSDPPIVRDALGTTLPAGLVERWGRATSNARSIVETLETSRHALALAKGAVTRGTYDLGSDGQVLDGIGADMDALLVRVRDLVPHAVCGKCGGARCVVCRGRGWLSERLFGQLEAAE